MNYNLLFISGVASKRPSIEEFGMCPVPPALSLS